MLTASSPDAQRRFTVEPGTDDREARQQRGHARDVAVVLAGLVGGAEVDILDQCGVDAGSRHDGLDDVGGKIVGANRRQCARVPTDRCSESRDDRCSPLHLVNRVAARAIYYGNYLPKSRTHLINRERVRCQRFGAAARREEGAYPSWIFDRRATRPRRERSATLRAKLWLAPGRVSPQSQNAAAMLLRRALPATSQSLAHPFPIYEMGSRETVEILEWPALLSILA